MRTPTFSGRNIVAVWINSVALLWIAPALLAQSGTAKLARGIDNFESGKYNAAIQDLKAAQPHLPKLADYVALYLASSRAGLKDFAQMQPDLAPFRKLTVPSPLHPNPILLNPNTLPQTPPASA